MAALQVRDGTDINPVSRTFLLTHGQPVERVVVWLHGYTNSPAQFSQLGQMCFERGYNVLVPRFPRHGLQERMTGETALLTAEDLAGVADEAVDIARGLGRQVVVGGLSMGGVMTGWLAQQRADIELALLMAPTFGVMAVPARLTRLVMSWLLLRSNYFLWWDPVLKGAVVPPLYAYPRFASRGLAAFLRLVFAVQSLARKRKPAARRIRVLTNANDKSVSPERIGQIVRLWQAKGADVQTHQFGADLKLGHDFIDPTQRDQHTDLSYPVITEMLK
jgi:carboxylesterase